MPGMTTSGTKYRAGYGPHAAGATLSHQVRQKERVAADHFLCRLKISKNLKTHIEVNHRTQL